MFAYFVGLFLSLSLFVGPISISSLLILIIGGADIPIALSDFGIVIFSWAISYVVAVFLGIPLLLLALTLSVFFEKSIDNIPKVWCLFAPFVTTLLALLLMSLLYSKNLGGYQSSFDFISSSMTFFFFTISLVITAIFYYIHPKVVEGKTLKARAD